MNRQLDAETETFRSPLSAFRSPLSALRFPLLVALFRRINLDTVIGLLLFGGSLYAYTITLGPTVLEGDAALFQYTSHVLGVTYPTGFPLYILLGKLWLLLFPFGEIAWRMNLFSAVCSAAALPLIYGAARRLLANSAGAAQAERQSVRWAALAAVLIFATLPTFWRWSTEAKTYALNMMLFGAVLYLLARVLERDLPKQQPETGSQRPENIPGAIDSRAPSSGGTQRVTVDSQPAAPRTHLIAHLTRTSPLALPALLLGLQISVHNTAILLIPGLFLLVWLNFRSYLQPKKALLLYLLLLIGPGLFYLYIPLRAEWLIAQYGRTQAIEHGLLADFYTSGLDGLWRYFAATDFTGGVTTNWGLVPQQFFPVYVSKLLVDEFTYAGVVLGVIGGLALLILQPRLFWPFFLIYAIPIPFVLTYGQGEQSAFLLPSFFIFSIFAGHTIILIQRLLTIGNLPSFSRTSSTPFSIAIFAPPLLTFILGLTLVVPQVRYNFNWLDAKWTRAIYDKWADDLAHPLEPNAAILAPWGDLTSFWYMQHAENRRPDLRGLYPPTEAVATDYLETGGDLYIAGPLQGWAPGIEERYQLIPWGRLVRIAPAQAAPQTLLPDLSQAVEATFDHKLRLIAVEYPAQAVGDHLYPVTLTWQALAELPPELTLSLRLSDGDGIVAQLDDRLLSSWFPRETLPAGQYLLSYVPIHIPLGTLPGHYRLQLTAYTNYRQPWPLVDGLLVLDLGEVEIVSPPADYEPDPKQFHLAPGYVFNGEIELVDHEYDISRVGQGKGFPVKLMWRAKTNPADNYSLLLEIVDAGGNVLRSITHRPVGGRAPTSSWQTGQFIRDQVDLVLPASAPVGPRAIRVRLSWLRPNGSKLPAWDGLLPLGNTVNLEWLEVVEKEGRIFTAPEVQQPVDVNLENKVRLIGYNSPQWSETARNIQLNRSACVADADACRIHLDFYWAGLSEMDQLYFVFVHVVDAGGQIVTQHDRSPGRRGKEPTTSWLPGEIIADPVDLNLPSTIPPGRYTLRVGMYLPPDGPRLSVLDHQGQAGGNFIEAGTVEIRN